MVNKIKNTAARLPTIANRTHRGSTNQRVRINSRMTSSTVPTATNMATALIGTVKSIFSSSSKVTKTVLSGSTISTIVPDRGYVKKKMACSTLFSPPKRALFRYLRAKCLYMILANSLRNRHQSRNLNSPSTIVPAIFTSKSSSFGMTKISRSKIVKSANFPGDMEPIVFSRPLAKAAPTVYARMA